MMKLSNTNTLIQSLKTLSVLCVFVVLAACGSDVKIKTTFNATKDIKEGSSVFLSDKAVGEVVDVSQEANKTIITIELSDEGITQVRKEAAVVVNRLKPNKPLEIYNLKESKPTVENGDELKGLDSMFQLGAWMVGESLDLGNNSLLGYVDAFQKYLAGDKFQEDKKSLQEGVKQLGKEAEGMAGALTQELKKATGDMGQVEQQAAQVVEQLGTELAPVMGELAKSGKVLVEQLDQFAKNIEQQDAEGKQLGTTVIESLAKALEKVNDSMDQAVAEGQEEVTKDSSTAEAEQVKAEPILNAVPQATVPEVVEPATPELNQEESK